MKNKFKYVIALLTMVVFFYVAGGMKVKATYQEETAQIEENKTEMSKWFDEEVQGYAVQFVVGLGTIVMGMSMFLKPFKKITGAFTKNTEKNEDAKKEIVDAKETIKKDNAVTLNCIKESNSATQKAIQSNNESTQKAIMEDNKKTLEAIDKRNKELQTLINKQSQALILLSKDEHWVKNGTSEKVANLLGSDFNGKTN